MSSCILFSNEDDAVRKVNIDELYERNQRRDLKQISVFNKILNRIHKRITITARNKLNDKHIWFIVPSFLFGEPVYDQTDCIAYVITKLRDNGFFIKFIHPSTLFISWDSVFSFFSPVFLSFQLSEVATLNLATLFPFCICLISGSFPSLPINKTLFKLPAII